MDDGFAEAVMDYLREVQGPLSYALIAVSAALEPIFPPYPGDLVSMFGAYLAFSAGVSVVGVYLAMSLGSTIGGMAVYEVGRFIGVRRERWPAWLRGPRTDRAITAVLRLFERHGPVLLAANRFWPTLRAVFFLAAGMAGLQRTQVAIFGGLSSFAWHGGIVLVAWAADRNFAAVVRFFDDYTLIASYAALAIVAIGVIRWAALRYRSAK